MMYMLLIIIFAIIYVTSSSENRYIPAIGLAVLPTWLLLNNSADLLFKIPLLWILIITLLASVILFSTEMRKEGAMSDNSNVMNKGAWLLSVLISGAAIVLILYENKDVFNKIIEYSELVKKPNYLHLETLIQFSPLAIFSIVGVLIASSKKEEGQ